MGKWVIRIALIGGSTLAALLIGEGLVRCLGLGGTFLSRGALHCADPEVGWTCLPDFDGHYILPGSFDVRVVSNHRGLRDKERPLEKPAGTRRILVLGDSFMWGYGVENDEIFSSVLESRLPGFETINFGVNGYSTVQEMVRLERDGFAYHPDWVVLCFCLNDLEDNLDDKDGGRPYATVDASGGLAIENLPVRRCWKSPFKQWLRHHSRLFNFFESQTDRLRLYRREKKQREEATGCAAGCAEVPDAGEDGGFSFLDLYGPSSPRLEHAWEAEDLLLARMKKRVQAEGAELLVVYVSAKETVEPDHFNRFMELRCGGEVLPDLDRDRPARRLGSICALLGIDYLNLDPVFHGCEEPLSLYLSNNGHWSAAGHRVAAEAAAEKLRALMNRGKGIKGPVSDIRGSSAR